MSDGFDVVERWPWGRRGHYERIIEYPEAAIGLIDALRLYLDVDERDYEDFKDEIDLTPEQLRKWQAKMSVLKLILKDLEDHGFDDTLCGVLKVKR